MPFSYPGPQGDTGQTGDTGITGDTGSQGDTGVDYGTLVYLALFG